MAKENTKKIAKMSPFVRFLVAIIGGGSWFFGGWGIFKVDNGIGSTALVLSGSIALLFAGTGRWPIELAFGKDGIYAKLEEAEEERDQAEERVDDVEAEFEQMIEYSKTVDKKDSVQVDKNGTQAENFGENSSPLKISVTPPKTYQLGLAFESQVGLALQRLYPGSRLQKEVRIGDRIADFELTINDVQIVVEIKYILSESRKSRWFERLNNWLLVLLSEVNRERKRRLLVVVNLKDIKDGQEHLLKNFKLSEAAIVTWSGPDDDAKLVEAISRLVE